MKLWLLLQAPILVACIGSKDLQPGHPTILVVNSGAHVLAVFGEQGYLGRVHPGDEECYQLMVSGGQTRLRVVVGRHTYYGPWFNTTEHRGGWEWDIGMDTRMDAATALVPSRRCRVRGGRADRQTGRQADGR